MTPSWLVQLTVILLIAGKAVRGDSRSYWPTKASVSKRANPDTISQTRTALSETHCAGLANKHNWTRLMCYQEGQCTFFDILIYGYQNDNEADSQDCYTNFGLVSCPFGWTAVMESCYLFSTSADTWNNARSACLDLGGDLIKINTNEENEYIKERMTDKSWIGLSDTVAIGIYQWSVDDPLSLLRWGPNQPNNLGGNENCVIYAPEAGNTFYDASCDVDYLFICEKKATYDAETYMFSCPSGWEIFKESCYLFSTEIAGYEKASALCQNSGSIMLQPLDEGEHEFISGRLTARTWVGVTDIEVEGLFRWPAHDGHIVTSDVWEAGSPSGSDEDCVAISANGKWEDKDCSNTYLYICETSVLNPVSR